MDVPTNVCAIELTSSPETPKSQSLISPAELHRIFDGLMSTNQDYQHRDSDLPIIALTSMDDLVYVVEVEQALQYGSCHNAHNLNVDGSNLLVDRIKGAFIRVLHADADVGVGEIGAVGGDDVGRVTVVHDL
jgi:hypothetical protein